MQTDRLILRDRTRVLIAEMLIQAKKEQLQFFGFDNLPELEEKLIRIEKGLANKKNDYRIFDMILKQTNEVIGSCGFHHWIKDHDRTEIGYALHKQFQKKGYMTEGLSRVLQFGFKEMDLNRIEALIEPENKQSMALMSKFGFVKEGVLRGDYKEGNEYENFVIFSLLKADYLNETHFK